MYDTSTQFLAKKNWNWLNRKKIRIELLEKNGVLLKNMDAAVLPIKIGLVPYRYNWSLTKLTLAYRIFCDAMMKLKKKKI